MRYRPQSSNPVNIGTYSQPPQQQQQQQQHPPATAPTLPQYQRPSSSNSRGGGAADPRSRATPLSTSSSQQPYQHRSSRPASSATSQHQQQRQTPVTTNNNNSLSASRIDDIILAARGGGGGGSAASARRPQTTGHGSDQHHGEPTESSCSAPRTTDNKQRSRKLLPWWKRAVLDPKFRRALTTSISSAHRLLEEHVNSSKDPWLLPRTDRGKMATTDATSAAMAATANSLSSSAASNEVVRQITRPTSSSSSGSTALVAKQQGGTDATAIIANKKKVGAFSRNTASELALVEASSKRYDIALSKGRWVPYAATNRAPGDGPTYRWMGDFPPCGFHISYSREICDIPGLEPPTMPAFDTVGTIEVPPSEAVFATQVEYPCIGGNVVPSEVTCVYLVSEKSLEAYNSNDNGDGGNKKTASNVEVVPFSSSCGGDGTPTEDPSKQKQQQQQNVIFTSDGGVRYKAFDRADANSIIRQGPGYDRPKRKRQYCIPVDPLLENTVDEDAAEDAAAAAAAAARGEESGGGGGGGGGGGAGEGRGIGGERPHQHEDELLAETAGMLKKTQQFLAKHKATTAERRGHSRRDGGNGGVRSGKDTNGASGGDDGSGSGADEWDNDDDDDGSGEDDYDDDDDESPSDGAFDDDEPGSGKWKGKRRDGGGGGRRRRRRRRGGPYSGITDKALLDLIPTCEVGFAFGAPKFIAYLWPSHRLLRFRLLSAALISVGQQERSNVAEGFKMPSDPFGTYLRPDLTDSRIEFLFSSDACRDSVLKIFDKLPKDAHNRLERKSFISFTLDLYNLYAPLFSDKGNFVLAEAEWAARGVQDDTLDFLLFFWFFFDIPLFLIRDCFIREVDYVEFWEFTYEQIFVNNFKSRCEDFDDVIALREIEHSLASQVPPSRLAHRARMELEIRRSKMRTHERRSQLLLEERKRQALLMGNTTLRTTASSRPSTTMSTAHNARQHQQQQQRTPGGGRGGGDDGNQGGETAGALVPSPSSASASSPPRPPNTAPSPASTSRMMTNGEREAAAAKQFMSFREYVRQYDPEYQQALQLEREIQEELGDDEQQQGNGDDQDASSSLRSKSRSPSHQQHRRKASDGGNEEEDDDDDNIINAENPEFDRDAPENNVEALLEFCHDMSDSDLEETDNKGRLIIFDRFRLSREVRRRHRVNERNKETMPTLLSQRNKKLDEQREREVKAMEAAERNAHDADDVEQEEDGATMTEQYHHDDDDTSEGAGEDEELQTDDEERRIQQRNQRAFSSATRRRRSTTTADIDSLRVLIQHAAEEDEMAQEEDDDLASAARRKRRVARMLAVRRQERTRLQTLSQSASQLRKINKYTMFGAPMLTVPGSAGAASAQQQASSRAPKSFIKPTLDQSNPLAASSSSRRLSSRDHSKPSEICLPMMGVDASSKIGDAVDEKFARANNGATDAHVRVAVLQSGMSMPLSQNIERISLRDRFQSDFYDRHHHHHHHHHQQQHGAAVSPASSSAQRPHTTTTAITATDGKRKPLSALFGEGNFESVGDGNQEQQQDKSQRRPMTGTASSVPESSFFDEEEADSASVKKKKPLTEQQQQQQQQQPERRTGQQSAASSSTKVPRPPTTGRKFVEGTSLSEDFAPTTTTAAHADDDDKKSSLALGTSMAPSSHSASAATTQRRKIAVHQSFLGDMLIDQRIAQTVILPRASSLDKEALAAKTARISSSSSSNATKLPLFKFRPTSPLDTSAKKFGKQEVPPEAVTGRFKANAHPSTPHPDLQFARWLAAVHRHAVASPERAPFDRTDGSAV